MRLIMYEIIKDDPHVSQEQKQKELEYKKYVDKHINCVKAAWETMKNNSFIIDFCCSEGQTSRSVLIPTMDMFIISHDNSKYGIDEWEAYRQYYYPVNEYEKQSAKAEYERAETHHYACNMHHPEYWINRMDGMTITSVMEMCCDWIAMSMVKGGTALEFYNTKFDKRKLGESQREWTEFILKEYYK